MLSPILPSHAFYNQKSGNVASAQSDNSESQPSAFFSLPPNLASAQSDNSESQPSASFSLFPNVAFAQTDETNNQPSASFSLFPNVAFAQTDETNNQPSDSFSLTVSSICEGDPGDIVGTDEGETLTGGDDADTILGCGGDDTLNGNGGDDILDGGDGNDRIHGNAGSHTLTGGDGADTFFCGEGEGSQTDVDTITDFNPFEDEIDGNVESCENIITVPVVPPPVITQPDTQDCEGAILIEGTAHPETDEIVLSIQGGPELGNTTDIDDMDGIPVNFTRSQ